MAVIDSGIVKQQSVRRGKSTNDYEEEYLEDELQIEVSDEFYSCYLENIKKLVIAYIDFFFQDKEQYGGGPIPQRRLHDPRYMNQILTLEISAAVKKAYRAMRNCPWIDSKPTTSNCLVPDDVRLLISVLADLKRNRVPEQFAPGMTLMYLEICEGVKF